MFNYVAAAAAKSLSRVRLCAIPEKVAHQAPLSLGFSRQEHWSGLPFPSPMRKSEVAQLCPTLSNPLDCGPSGSSIHGIFQPRVLEWGAIAFSKPPTKRIQMIAWHFQAEAHTAGEETRGLCIFDLPQSLRQGCCISPKPLPGHHHSGPR